MGQAVMRFFYALVSCFFLFHAVSAQAVAQDAESVRIAGALDDSSLAAQVLLAGIDGKGSLDSAMSALLRAVPPGGIMLFRYNLSTERRLVAPFLAQVRGAVVSAWGGGAGLPPLVAVDHEGGGVHRFGEGVTRLPSPFSYWERVRTGAAGREETILAIEAASYASALELRELGITVNLAPVAEALSPENRRFLGSRSYGPDALFVEEAAGAFIRGMGRAGIRCVIKHFPGNSGGDPHERAVSLGGDRGTLDGMVRPMTALFGASPQPMVMVSHVRVPALDPERSASLSPAVITAWLRGELGFTGVVVADDFSMAGSTERDAGRAVVMALNAGVDMVMCWPSNLAATRQAIVRALSSGRLPRERLVEAAARIIAVKRQAGLVGPGAAVSGDSAGAAGGGARSGAGGAEQ